MLRVPHQVSRVVDLREYGHSLTQRRCALAAAFKSSLKVDRGKVRDQLQDWRKMACRRAAPGSAKALARRRVCRQRPAAESQARSRSSGAPALVDVLADLWALANLLRTHRRLLPWQPPRPR